MTVPNLGNNDDVREVSAATPPAAADQRIVIIGGCGRVGLPLGLAFAMRGRHVTLYDTNTTAVDLVNVGQMPYGEHGTIDLTSALWRSDTGVLVATANPAAVAVADVVIVVVGTPVDEHRNPDPATIPHLLVELNAAGHLRHDQLVILRSTVYPGTTSLVEDRIPNDVAVCPERIAEGRAMTELFELPQIIGARSATVAWRAAVVFNALTDDIVTVTPEEAELAKLFTNMWRYVQFAAANEMWSIATAAGVDYETVRSAITHRYPRAAGLPGAGFTAGPCLLKDTLQVAAFAGRGADLARAAVDVNEGLPRFIVDQVDQMYILNGATVGILGLAFKGNSDDRRDSLAYKLAKILYAQGARVLATDPRVDDPHALPLDDVLTHADLLIVAAPHDEYRDLKTDLPVIDVWGITGRELDL